VSKNDCVGASAPSCCSRDSLTRDQIQLLATKPKSGKPPLCERIEAAGIPSIGMDIPGGGAPLDGRAAMAQAIVRAGRRRRGEEP
jgi:hypothetical protein